MIYALGPDKPSAASEDHFIAENAIVIGRVRLERNASIWFNAVVRADNDLITIGENSNVQDGAILHTDSGLTLTIGRNVTIGHKVMLHGCDIGDNSLIGINSVVLNRARIGRNCLVGANSLVTEGKEFPEGSMIMGAPAKVVRPLRPHEIQMLEGSALHYVENWKRFKAGLVPLPGPEIG
jgi:carbonic anhydrase/acetyltransferase-like protein (isoleucine patch superfamily)